MNSVKQALERRHTSVKVAIECAVNKHEWKMDVNGWVLTLTSWIFAPWRRVEKRNGWGQNHYDAAGVIQWSSRALLLTLTSNCTHDPEWVLRGLSVGPYNLSWFEGECMREVWSAPCRRPPSSCEIRPSVCICNCLSYIGAKIYPYFNFEVLLWIEYYTRTIQSSSAVFNCYL